MVTRVGRTSGRAQGTRPWVPGGAALVFGRRQELAYRDWIHCFCRTLQLNITLFRATAPK